ncbi:MAG TPA: pyridoxine 5'-phosphate synthase [Candidatus Goldiibacteriota bacterium]|nr:pyridoxine 5'-phosphate synthase [Candidatus Goldiibacteriota bacterium]
MAKLCVNIDHVATVRQARGGKLPDPVEAARIVEKAGASGITVHLREDRRHINDDDVMRLRRTVRTKLNLEMSVAPDVVKRAMIVVPDEATIVPEKRRELTTEGGLDVVSGMKKLIPVIRELKRKGVVVSLFINPDLRQIRAAVDSGADFIEIHTGKYADARTKAAADREFARIRQAAKYACSLGLGVNAGHGLNYNNTTRVSRLKEISELNTGHSIVARAVICGLENAVKEMIALL